MYNNYIITIDTDFISDSILNRVADFFIHSNVKSTWFITNKTEVITKLLDHKHLFELGIHTNFNKGSTQGKYPREIIRNLLNILPNCKSMRTHGLKQSSKLLWMLCREFGIVNDVSLLLIDTPNIRPHKIFYSKYSSLIRYPYFWEDDFEANSPSPVYDLAHSKYNVYGLKIFNFHPIHILLNSFNIDNYLLCKSEVNLKKCSLSTLSKYANYNGEGVRTLFLGLLKLIKNSSYSKGLRISDL